MASLMSIALGLLDNVLSMIRRVALCVGMRCPSTSKNTVPMSVRERVIMPTQKNMTYELAKQLKDAGFPQEGRGLFFTNEEFKITSEIIEPGGVHSIPRGSITYYPNLSELIEACEKDFESLISRGNGEGDNFEARSKTGRFHGSTPEEAVANLWLKLNNK